MTMPIQEGEEMFLPALLPLRSGSRFQPNCLEKLYFYKSITKGSKAETDGAACPAEAALPEPALFKR